MISMNMNLEGVEAPHLLCLGAHSDDIEIGALATILGLAASHRQARITWVVFAADGEREQEARASAAHCTREFGQSSIELHAFRDGQFPAEIPALKEEFERLKQKCRPHIIFTHQRSDLHQDHRAVSDLTWQTFRDHLILEYEIPKYDGDLGAPNVFSEVSQALHDEKLAVLDRFFATQKNRSWFSPDTFSAIMRLRAIECRAGSGFAEAFYCRKMKLFN